MSKRPSPYDIEKSNEVDPDYIPDVGKIDTPQEIAERKIISVKGLKKNTTQEKQTTKLLIKAPLPNLSGLVAKIDDNVDKNEQRINQLKLIQEGLSSENLSKHLHIIRDETDDKDLTVSIEKPQIDLKLPNLFQSNFSNTKLFNAQENKFPTILTIPTSKYENGLQSPVIFMTKQPSNQKQSSIKLDVNIQNKNEKPTIDVSEPKKQ